MIKILLAWLLVPVLAVQTDNVHTKQVLVQVAPVYPTAVLALGYDIRVIPCTGTPLAMTIYTTEDHVADWIAARLDQPMWLTLEPKLLPYPNGLAWRVYTVAVYDLDTGVWVESVTTRIKNNDLDT